MRNIYDVIVRPVVTEKSADQLDQHSVYTFVVANEANKLEIAQAIETLFNVGVSQRADYALRRQIAPRRPPHRPPRRLEESRRDPA